MIPFAIDVGEALLDALDFFAVYGVGALILLPGVIGACYGVWWIAYWVLSAVFAVHDRLRPNDPASGRLARWVDGF